MLKVLALLILSTTPALAQNATPKEAGAAIPRPDAKNYVTYEAYEDALIDWRIQQNAAKKVAPTPTCTTMIKCRAALKEALALNESLKASMSNELAEAANKNEAMQKQLGEKNQQYSDALAIMDALYYHQQGQPIPEQDARRITELSGSQDRAYFLGQKLATGQNAIVDYFIKLRDHDKEATEKYNSLLADYKNYATRVDAALSRQQRINNALAFYALMPKYTPPPQIIAPTVLSNPNINCTSSTYGLTTYTNCH